MPCQKRGRQDKANAAGLHTPLCQLSLHFGQPYRHPDAQCSDRRRRPPGAPGHRLARHYPPGYLLRCTATAAPSCCTARRRHARHDAAGQLAGAAAAGGLAAARHAHQVTMVGVTTTVCISNRRRCRKRYAPPLPGGQRLAADAPAVDRRRGDAARIRAARARRRADRTAAA
ncbi:Uncharacterised protein [Serratia rubidaea]|uniref:Uncharacterized protein n=1 Tax=Serratia rubidaea TaxID=61652 RepID=A0A4U9HV83_SERRU|nr:Uncharacterised protein [Serratia rubidaea]